MSSTVEETIAKKLHSAFSPSQLEVINESHKHAGHHHDDETFDGNGETHFRVKIVSQKFENMNRVEIHRTITDVLRDELNNGLHALAIEAKS